jgi:two-component system repressor protein LuxO
MHPDTPNVLIIDDDPVIHALMSVILKRHGYRPHTAVDLKQAAAVIPQYPPAVILLDWMLDEQDGLEILGRLRREMPTVPVVLITAHSSVDIAVRAIKQGAFDFLSKPVDEGHMLAVLVRAVEHHRLLEQVRSLRADGSGDPGSFEGIIGASPPMRTVYEIIQNVAPIDVSVMICGESGTGKELVARAIHKRSARSRGAFIALNMAAMPKELVESTLFGHEKGAFTGADRRRDGAVEEARGGTLFLDEICEMPLDIQSKLLRFLQERVYRRVGGTGDLESDVRIVSATNRDPLAEVRENRMRADLYYRLNVVPIVIPPLRERREDIPLLATAAMKRYSAKYNKKFEAIGDEALQQLKAAHWPGNVRQLIHVIQRIVIMHDGPVLDSSMLPIDLIDNDSTDVNANLASNMSSGLGITPPTSAVDIAGAPVATPVAALPATETGDEIVPLETLERRAIERAIQLCDGSVSDAAARLGVSTATVYRKLKAYGISAE